MTRRPPRWSPAVIIFVAGSTQSLAAGPFGASVDLRFLNGTNGYVINGIEANNAIGATVSSAGDLNGDGIADLVIGARHDNQNGSFSGESYVVFGGAGVGSSGTLELSALNGSNGFVLKGISSFNTSPHHVSAAGDINGDGVDDLIIGASHVSTSVSYSGQSYVVFGDAAVGAGGTIDLSTLNGTNGFVINGIDVQDRSGNSVSCAGDVNGDGVDDLIIGAYHASPNGVQSGESYVVFGSAAIGAGGTLELASLNGSNGFVLNGIDAFDNSGSPVAFAGDFNNDGFDDLTIGARLADVHGQGEVGEGYVIFGAAVIGASGTLELSSLNGANGFIINGLDADDWGGGGASAGDVNGDGITDLLFGTRHADPNGTSSGQSHVLFGGAGVGTSGIFEISSLNGSNGFDINGIDAFDQAGFSATSSGDVNGDGRDDLAIGALLADPNGSNSGESYVIFGFPGIGTSGTIELSSLNGANGFVIKGANAHDLSGRIAFAGDVNADGLDDLIIGAQSADPRGSQSGQCYVIFGRIDCPIDLLIDQNDDGLVDSADLGIMLGFFGSTDPLHSKADINNDGIVDTADLGILLGAFGIACP